MATTSDSASLPQASDEHSLEGLPSQTQDGSATPDAMELARVSSEDELISRACTVTDDLTNPSTRTSSALQHSGSPAWRDEGATVVAAQTGAGDDVANSAEMPSPLEEEPSQQLSSEDVIELNKFNEGKSRIEEFLQILDQRPKLEPLADCKEAGNRPSDEIWPDLDARIAETESWIDEVERIEEEATAWNAADVERLRRVSKEASERHMSPQDADLVELALETLVALDKLLHLCGFRRDQLELLRARLEWESHRRHCWDVYRTLLADVDEFVTARARWTTEVYLHGVGRNPDSNASSFDSDRLSPETPLRSPLRERSSASRQRVSARLDADSQKLAHRINAFAKATGECGDVLDGVMECHKLPDEFLDEQDRLENLTSSMAARSELLDQLVRQWHQSDSAYSTLQTLAADAQRTTAKLRDEEQGVPDSQRAQDFSGQIASFCQRLETLIGPEQASSVNLATPLGAQPSLRRHLRPVQPQEQIYADQAEHTRALEDALSLEMHKTVTAVREAKSALERHFRALRALQLIQRLVASLDSLTNQCRAVAEQATSGFEVESPSTGADTSAQRSLANPGSKPDLTLLEALKAPAHDVYLSRLPGLRPTLAGLVVKGADLRKEIDAATLEAVKAGLIPSAFRRQLDKSLANFEQVKRDTDAAIEDGSEVVVMLKQLRTADQLIDAVQKNAAALLQRVNEDCIKVAEAYPWRSVNSTDALRDLRASLQVARERMTETRQARAASERALQLAAGLAKANEASSIQRHLVDSSFEADRRVSQAEAALRWLEVSLDQLGAVVDLRSTFEEATAQGHQVAELISQHAGQSVATLASSVATFSQQALSVPMTGDAPTVLFEPVVCADPSFRSVDEEVRKHVNGWSTELETLKERVESLARQRQVRLDEERSSQQKRNDALDAVANASTAVDGLVKHVKAELAKHEDEMKATAAGQDPRQLHRLHQLQETVASWTQASTSRLHVAIASLTDACDEAARLGCTESTLMQHQQLTADARSHVAQLEAQFASLVAAINQSIESCSRFATEEAPPATDGLEFPVSLDPSSDDLESSSSSRLEDNAHTKQQGASEMPQVELALTESVSDGTGAEVDVGDVSIDVFGPKSVLSTKSSDAPTAPRGRELDTVQDLVGRLEAEDKVFVQTLPDGSLQKRQLLRLPTTSDDEQAQAQMRRHEEEVYAASSSLSPSSSQSTELAHALAKRQGRLRRHSRLSRFGDLASQLENQLGELVELLDSLDADAEDDHRSQSRQGERNLAQSKSAGTVVVNERLEGAQTLLAETSIAADHVLDDVRVKNTLANVNALHRETRAMADEILGDPELRRLQRQRESVVPSPAFSLSSASSTEVSSAEYEALSDGRDSPHDAMGFRPPSREASPAPVRRKAQLPSQSIRTLSAAAATDLISASRRTVSEGSPLVRPISRTSSAARRSGIPRSPRKRLPSEVNPATTEQTTAGPEKPGALGHLRLPSALSTPVGSKLPVRTPSRATSISSVKVSSRRGSRHPNRYRPNVNNKLDVAVSRIVNQLPQPIQIAHAATAPDAAPRDAWKDDSGRYWVGSRNPRLCFCRFLRSRIVMVRIGGGWQELGRYIEHHYTDLMAEGATSAVSPSASDLPWIKGGDVLTATPTHLKRSTIAELHDSASAANVSPQEVASIVLTPAEGRRLPSGSYERVRTPSSSSRRSVTPGGGGGGGGGSDDTPTMLARRRVESVSISRPSHLSVGAAQRRKSSTLLVDAKMARSYGPTGTLLNLSDVAARHPPNA